MKALLISCALLAAAGAAVAGPGDPAPSTWGSPIAPLAASAAAAAPAPGAAPANPAPPAQAASSSQAMHPVAAARAASSGGAAQPAGPYTIRRADSGATGDYFHDFAELIVRVRSVKWIEEICSEAFPATAELNQHAYGDWIHEHGAFVAEIEGQFDLIDHYWADMSPDLRKSGVGTDALRRMVDAQRDALRDEFHATSPTVFQRRCDAYPEILLSPQLDLENSQSDFVRSVRLGPR